ncbi:MAG: serine/threonine-protein phosphatase [Parasporobacterium sp.]|nr:serine/threonine-protein phosphatase [Parasporobacterium sp.]MBQ9032964.1 serine/threonine-protein phosphatase [Parasporobacterium sp.]
MEYLVRYSCLSDIGCCRAVNQDNYICGGQYLTIPEAQEGSRINGTLIPGETSVAGVFDGLGGEEQGEMASFLAAQCAAQICFAGDPVEELREYCQNANAMICHYASDHQVAAMGTTAAVLAFTKERILLCNIGDSPIFRFGGKKLEKLSVDHIAPAPFGRKAPLSQNLGIDPAELVIEPYVAVGTYHPGDLYLICSDGLTDMADETEIGEILSGTAFEKAADRLLQLALSRGGRDNVTILLCRIERARKNLLHRAAQSVKRIIRSGS